MEILTVEEIVRVTGGEVLCGENRAFTGLSIDSRKVRSGELFIALKGVRFDGHDFVREALREAAGALVSRPPAEPAHGKVVIRVEGTLKALQDIAGHLRMKRTVPVIGVTGTNGKTTTKELIASILARRHRVLKTSGNFNNHIGLPLCVSNMRGDEEFMVLEMGSNARGDIRLLCDIARPDLAVVTNVGLAHLEGFGSLEAVRDTDLEILPYVRAAAVNADDRFLMEGMKECKGRMITYGIDNPADVSADDVIIGERGSRFTLSLPGREGVTVSLRLSGRFNISNALGAAAVAHEAGICTEDIKAGLESFTGVPMRLEIREIAGALVISDVYNANPSSMEGALNELIRLRRKRMIAVLGDMLELGAYAEGEHRKLVERLKSLGIDILIAVGPEMHRASEGFSGPRYRASHSDEARSMLFGILREGDTVLIKGSRGMRMERVLASAEGAAVTEGGNAV